ncbi:hypothetical protein Btru_075893 [Bulinus truncatus]|nr:hypothetical protein Btru_075893 [Bulinus truncatus]
MFHTRDVTFHLVALCIVQFYIDTSALKTSIQYKCSACALTNETSLLSPVTLSRRSRLECSATCSSAVWCLKFLFSQQRTCLLFLSPDTPCPVNLATSQTSLYVKEVDAVPAPCKMTRRLALDGGQYKVDYQSFLQSQIVGNDLKINFSAGNSTYLTCTNSYVIPTNLSYPIWATTPAYTTGGALLKVYLSLRTFFVNEPTVSEEYYNIQTASVVTTPSVNQWITQLRADSGSGKKVKVFSTGSNASTLLSAVVNGYSMNFLMLGASIRYLTANAVIKDGQNVVVQSSYYDGKKVKFVSVRSWDSPNIVSWDYISRARNEAEPVGSEFTIYGDPCWTYVALTPPSNITAFQQLKTAILSGKKVRVGFTVDAQVIYATPAYLCINTTDIITAHVVNIIKRTSLLNLGLLLFTSSKLHYILSTDGFLQEYSQDFGSDNVAVTDKWTSVQWFVDQQNFTLVHSTASRSSPNQTTFQRLKETVAGGCEVRIRVYLSSSEFHYFTCETLQLTNDGSVVQCHVSGQLAVDFLGNTMTVTQSSSGGLINLNCIFNCPTTTTTTYSPTVTSGCPQFLTVNTNGLMDSYVSCLEADAQLKNATEQWVNVDWFAAE